MANLIITIISIALVAVAALMGAYYGGAAFLEGSAKANANMIMNQALQINSAVMLWWTNTNRTQSNIPDWNNLARTSTSLIPGYLSSMPQLPSGFDKWEIIFTNGGGFINYTAIATEDASGTFTGMVIYLANDSTKSLSICQQFNKIATGSTSIATIADPLSGTETVASIFGGYKMRCFLNGGYPEYHFVIKIG